LVRDLVEVTELIKSLGPLVESFYASVASLRGYIGSHPGITTRQLGEANIAYQFSILNLIRDTSATLHVLSTWRSHYDHILATIGVPENLHLSATSVPQYNINTRLNAVVGVPYTSILVHADVRTKVFVHHRTVQYKITAPEFKGAQARLRQLIDSLGILDVSAVWDSVVPFSFILDWFFKIRDWLHAYARPHLYKADVELTDYCESFSLERSVTWSADYDQFTFTPYVGALPPHQAVYNSYLGTSTYWGYVRRRFKPPPVTAIPGPTAKNSLLTLRHLSVASTLAALRIPRD
jgi:hypothetical protein